MSVLPAASLPYLPPNAAAHGLSLDAHLLLNLEIAAALFVLAHLLGFAAVVLSRRDVLRRQWLFEYVPLAFLAGVFAFLAFRAETLWAATRYTGADLGALQVEVTGMQFAWYFRYPGADAAFGRTRPELVSPGEGNPVGIDPADERGKDDFVRSELVLPAGREVDLHLRAVDVIHGFSVPALRIKQNAVPGLPMHIHFTPTTPGTYAVLCTQLCGMGHYRMTADVRVLAAADYAAWVAAQEKAATP